MNFDDFDPKPASLQLSEVVKNPKQLIDDMMYVSICNCAQLALSFISLGFTSSILLSNGYGTESGISITTRKRLASYKNSCFVASEAVKWVVLYCKIKGIMQ